MGKAKRHVHHWLVDPPNGEESKATCACGETATFRNSEGSEPITPQQWHQRVSNNDRKTSGTLHRPVEGWGDTGSIFDKKR